MGMDSMTPPPISRERCAQFEDALALVPLGEASAEDEVIVRAHAAACNRCHMRLAEYDLLSASLRSLQLAAPIPVITIAVDNIILSADLSDAGDHCDEVDSMGLRDSPTLQTSQLNARQHRHVGRIGAWGAVAAVVLLALFARMLIADHMTQAPTTRTLVGGGVLTEFHLSRAGKRPLYIVAGPDGNLWFTGSGSIGRITTDGVITEFRLPVSGDPTSIVAGPDHDLWITVNNDILRVSMSGIVTRFPLPPAFARPLTSITTGPDGSIWFVESGDSYSTSSDASRAVIGRISPRGSVTSVALEPGYVVGGIIALTDGSLWCSISNVPIERVSPDGTITRYDNPTLDAMVFAPAVGADGNIWFVGYDYFSGDANGGRFGYITSSGAVRYWSFPTAMLNTDAGFPLRLGPDGNFWTIGNAQVLRMTPTGDITGYQIPADIRVSDMAFGSDGNLWITETNANVIGRIHLRP